MAINLFEGARRVTYLLVAVWVLGGLLIAVDSTPKVRAYYEVRSPQQPPVRVESLECRSGGDMEWLYDQETPSGTRFDAEFCFLTAAFQADAGNRELIPYKVDSSGILWGAEAYSPQVSEYERRVRNEFRPADSDAAWIDGRKWPLRYEHARDSLLWIIGGPVALIVAASLIGWVVRGFMGIPSGKDH